MPITQFASDLAAAIRARRSIRSYSEEPVAASEVLEILSLAGRAPSAWNLQPWRFIAVVEPDAKTALQQVAFNQPQVASAPVVIVLYSDMADTLDRVDVVLPAGAPPAAREKIRESITGYFQQLSPVQSEAWGRSQANIALGYLLMILESRGYGSSPMLGFDPAGVRKLFALPEHAEIAALVAFGNPAVAGRASDRRPVESLMRFS